MEYEITLSTTDYAAVDTAIKIKQNDYGSHTFLFSVGAACDYALIKFKRGDGLVVVSDSLSVQDGLVTYAVENAVIEKSGQVRGEISFYEDDARITTNVFTFVVVPEIGTDDAVEDDDRLPVLEGLMAQVEQIADQVEALNVTADESAQAAAESAQAAEESAEGLSDALTTVQYIRQDCAGAIKRYAGPDKDVHISGVDDAGFSSLVLYGGSSQGDGTSGATGAILSAQNFSVTACAKNLFDTDAWYTYLVSIQASALPTKRGTDQGHDYIAIHPGSYSGSRFMDGAFAENTQYTIGYWGRQETLLTPASARSTGIQIRYTDGSSYSQYIDNTEQWRYYTVTTDAGKTVSAIALSYNYPGYGYFSEVMMVRGGIVPEYVPYEGKSAQVDIALCGIPGDGGYLSRDYVTVSRGTVTLTRTVDSAQFDEAVPIYGNQDLILDTPTQTDITQTSAGQALLALTTYKPETNVFLSTDLAAAGMEYSLDLDTLLKEQAETALTRYGVRFLGSANSGGTVSRLYDAAGLVANVGTDTETATNDFDDLYPWRGMRRCCGQFDSAGNFLVNAYAGEPGYATDGTGGEVWVEIPLFYYRHDYGADGSETIEISPYPITGYLPAPIFVTREGTLLQRAYVAAYPMGLESGSPTSRSGVYPPAVSLNQAMTNARMLGGRYATTTAAEHYTLCLLMWVEFATRNLQAVMAGCSTLPYAASHTAEIAEQAANRIVISSARAAEYVVGSTIAIGTALGVCDIASNRTVTAIESYDDVNSAMEFDGAPVDIAVGNVVSAAAWKTGSCDSVLSSSGSPVSNTSGKYTCVYRGIESPYANAYTWICDLLFKREGEGTDDDPYVYDIYYLPDAASYNSGTVTDDYVKIQYPLPGANGYVKRLGYDSRYPWVRMPAEVGGMSTTYYGDSYTLPNRAVTAASVGGPWHGMGACGPLNVSCIGATSVDIKRCARLSYVRG